MGYTGYELCDLVAQMVRNTKPPILAMKKNEIMPFAAIWMDLEIILLNEVSQTETDKYTMISLTCEI